MAEEARFCYNLARGDDLPQTGFEAGIASKFQYALYQPEQKFRATGQILLFVAV